MPKCDFNKVAWQLRQRCSPANLLHIFRAPFPRNTSGWLLLTFLNDCSKNHKKNCQNLFTLGSFPIGRSFINPSRPVPFRESH